MLPCGHALCYQCGNKLDSQARRGSVVCACFDALILNYFQSILLTGPSQWQTLYEAKSFGVCYTMLAGFVAYSDQLYIGQVFRYERFLVCSASCQESDTKVNLRYLRISCSAEHT